MSYAEIEHVVRPEDLASAWGNDFPVIATPVLLWLTEIAAMKAFAPTLPEDSITLGLAHDSRHTGATLVGKTITVEATLVERDERTCKFRVRAHEAGRTLLQGTHTRAVVAEARFRERIEQLGAML